MDKRDAVATALKPAGHDGAGPWPLLALGTMAVLFVRACVPMDSSPAPAGAVPVFDTALATRFGNQHAIAALDALTPQSPAAQVLDALNRSVVEFEPGATQLPESAVQVLQHAARVLAARSQTERYRIAGNADGRASALADLELSRRRAQAVADALVRDGVEGARLDVLGQGDQQPVSNESTEEARFRNRRIEFSLLP
jgi:outer membrane protein OmpA-like peptidoglycan-associated protein